MLACVLGPVGAAAIFLILNVAALLIILVLNRRPETWPVRSEEGGLPPLETGPLDASAILSLEFGYAQTTASEAMRDRLTIINFFLLTVGIVASGLLTTLRGELSALRVAGPALLWLLCCVGWFFFLKVIRLRQAWHHSARVMNQIKLFYVSHAKQFPASVLQQAFLWRADTLPAPDKPWTLFFYSAMLVGFLDSVAFTVGGILLALPAQQTCFAAVVGALVALGLVFLTFHAWLYFAFLRS
jgi:hypothetical protein